MSAGFQVAAKALEAAVFGAYFNVTINLKDITDEAFKLTVRLSDGRWSSRKFLFVLNRFFFLLQTQKRVSELLKEAKENVASILDAAEKRS